MEAHHDHMDPATLAVHAGPAAGPDPAFGGVSVPIYQSSTFIFANTDVGADRFEGRDQGFKYTRLGNPTNRALEQAVAQLEDGYDSLTTSTGMGAVSTVFIGMLKSGDHVLGTDSVYGPSRLLVEKQLAKFGVTSNWVDTASEATIRKAIRPGVTRMLYIETPANPTIKITDLEMCGRIAKEFGLLFVVDNTFSSPLLQQPFKFGADIVVHSMTKYLNGHSDVVAGIIVTKTKEMWQMLQGWRSGLGCTMDPHQAWLVLRGIRTLHLRVHAAQENASKIAAFLEAHPLVAWVSYPGLKSHPQHELCKKQMKGPGSMISFGVKGGLEGSKLVINSVKLATLAVSLGGVETLIEHPASMTHTSVPRVEREAAGISDDLIRLAVGCEAFEDLRADLDQALNVLKLSGMKL